jgi:hypothetical protein
VLLRVADLILLAIALPVFLLAGWPLLGYAVAAAAWLLTRAAQLLAERRARVALRGGNRRGAMGAIAFARMGRVGTIALAVLLVGVAEREAGLAAALLSAALFSAYLAGQGLARLLDSQERSR